MYPHFMWSKFLINFFKASTNVPRPLPTFGGVSHQTLVLKPRGKTLEGSSHFPQRNFIENMFRLDAVCCLIIILYYYKPALAVNISLPDQLKYVSHKSLLYYDYFSEPTKPIQIFEIDDFLTMGS